MSDDGNTALLSPATVMILDTHARKDSIARVALACWTDRPGQESLMQLTNPIGQHIAFYVHADEKKRFIEDMRKMLSAWEAQP